MSSSAHPLPSPGDSLADGRYVLTELIGEGASAGVYRGTDARLDLPRAIKVLRPGGQRTDEQRARLRSEARTLSELSHPNVLRMFDFGSDGAYDFVVMQLAEGGSLSERVRDEGPLPPTEAVGYALQTLAALTHAHERGIVHRDVKPQNILLDRDGVALLADFGIALITDDDTRSTRTGVAMGTMAFMAPEQRLDARSVGPQADVYATATTLYNLLTDDNPVDLFTATDGSPRWTGIDPRIADVIRRAVRYDPAERYPTAPAMAEKLIPILDELEGAAASTPVAAASTEAAKYLTDHATGHTLTPATLPGAGSLGDVTAPVPELPRAPLPLSEVETVLRPGRGKDLRLGAPIAIAAVLLAALGLFAVQQGLPSSPEPTQPTRIETSMPRPDPAPEPAPIVPEPDPVIPAAPPTPERVAQPPPKPAPKPAPTAVFPLGTWIGQLGGRPFTLTLAGTPEAFTGTQVMRNGRKEVHTDVRGSYHADSGVLEWHDVGELPDATDVHLTRTGDGFTGEYTARYSAGRGPVVLVERK